MYDRNDGAWLVCLWGQKDRAGADIADGDRDGRYSFVGGRYGR